MLSALSSNEPLNRFNQKLSVIKAFTRSVVVGDHTGLYISGPHGTGKSWGVDHAYHVHLSDEGYELTVDAGDDDDDLED